MKIRFWFLSILILVFVCSYFFSVFYETERNRKIEEVLEHQKIHARQAARGFDELFEKWNNVLLYLSNEPDIKSMSDRGKLELNLLLDIFGNEIKGITRVNSSGKIIFTTPYHRNSIGADISKQKHMVKILYDHKPVVSDVFNAVQGFRAIVIHYPVFKDGTFDGTIAFILNFQNIAKKVLDEIRIGNSGYAWMISGEGIELYCPVQGHVGKSIFETSQGFPGLVSMAKKMTAGQEGTATYTYNRIENKLLVTEKTAYYIPVKISNTFWSIAVVYSKDEITASLSKFRNKLIIIFTFIFIGGIFISFFGIKTWVVLKETDARKTAEKELVESERRFEQLIIGLPQLVWTCTPEGLCDYLSAQWIDYTGIPESEQLGSNWFEQIHHDDQNDLIAAWGNSINQKTDFHKEYRIRRHDGVYRWFDSRALPLRDADGIIIKWFGSSTDIQSEYDMREELKISEERYRIISSAASDYMFSSKVDKNGNLYHDWVGGAFETITGYTLKEYIERGGWRSALHPGDIEIDNADFEKLKKNQPVISELRTITKSGNVVWVRVYASPVWDDKKNRLKGITGAVQNITEKKLAEEELNKLYTAIEQSPAAIVLTNINGQIQYVNNMFTKISGFTFNEIKNKPLRILKPVKNNADISKHIWQTILSGSEWRGEYQNKRKDGSIYWESTLISPMTNKNGTITNFLAIQEDITEKKNNIEELILAKEKAEEAIKVKNVFLANMSHELRTPLIGILGYSEMLSNELKKLEDLEMAMGIKRSGVRLLNTLNLILDLTRIESDKFELNLKTTNLTEEIKFVYHTFNGAALDKKLNFSLQVIHRGLYAKIDERVFRIILENLVNNAIKFTKAGSITIIAGIEKNKTVYIEVKDTGIGIAKEHQEIIFEEFRQVSEGISRDYQGTGLGLSITKKYVEILGGTISVQSDVGVGSSFILRFPLVEKTNDADGESENNPV